MSKLNFVPVSPSRKSKQKESVTIKRMVTNQILEQNASVKHMLQDGLFDVAEFIKELIENPPRSPKWPIKKQFYGVSGRQEAVYIDLHIQKFPDPEISERMY